MIKLLHGNTQTDRQTDRQTDMMDLRGAFLWLFLLNVSQGWCL